MSNRIGLRTGLGIALLGASALWAAGTASAGGAKVPKGDEIKAKVEKLYNGTISPDDNAGREKIFVEIDKILQKDTKNVALKTPDFWVEAVQEGRFAGGKRSIGKTKVTASEDIEIVPRDAKPDDKPMKAKVWYRAGALVNPTKPCPLLVAILPKDGVDPKTYLEGTWVANDDVQKNWIVAAMQESNEFPVTKDPAVILRPFKEILDRFNTDANRWYLEGVGASCASVQTAASQFLANRLAGLILRGPTGPITSVNTALYPTVVVHGKTDTKGGEVFTAYQKIDPTANAEVLLDDVNTLTALNDQVIAWIAAHPKRVLPPAYSFVTTITDTDGENWTGSLNIVSPGKRGQPTKVTVKYIREDPVTKLPNTVDIQCENLGEFWLYMNDDLLDLDKEVAVFVNGTQLAKKVFDRDLRRMFEIADTYGEWGRMFPARFRGVVPTKIVAPPAPPANPDPNAPQPPGNNPPASPPATPPANPPAPPATPPAPPK
jgi:hypothetical protein